MNKREIKKITPIKTFMIIFSLFFILAFFTEQTFAQTGGQSFDDVISVTIFPQNPRPNEEVTIILKSFQINLDSSSISWFVGGKTSASNVSRFSFVAPASGKNLTISVVIKTSSGEFLEKTFSIKPASVDLLWQARTTTPPFYKGKALHSVESSITAVAIPNLISQSGLRIGPKNLVYTWRLNGEVRGDSSGLGKDSFSFRGSIFFRPAEIEVEVKTKDGTLSAKSSQNIEVRSPEIVFYEDHSLLGSRYENVLGKNISSKNKELVVKAEPYFFSGNLNNLEYDWQINRQSATSENDRKNVIVLRNEEEESVSAELSLEIKNLIRFLQFARENITLSLNP